MPARTPASDIQFALGEPVLVADAAQRRALGLDFWVDGTFGVCRQSGADLAVAPNGPTLATHNWSGGSLLDGVVTASRPISGLPPEVSHAAGGPLYDDPDSAMLLLVYHGETFRDGDYRDFYSFLGMAVSVDRGATFVDLGRIVMSDLEESDPERPRPVEVGSGGFVVRDGWFNLFFQDRNAQGVRLNLGLARARLADVFESAEHGMAPEYSKYFAGRFDQPGLGGRATELLPDVPFAVHWHDAAYVQSLDQILVVYSTVERCIDDVAMWNHAATFSPDGVRWSHPRLLNATPSPAEMLYVTIDSGGVCQRTIVGDSFDLYRVRSTTPYRWDDARLERVTVDFGSLDESALSSADTP